MSSVGSPAPGSRASLGDVARLAGVSPITASRVVNASEAVRPATRDRVLAAMQQLGYTPNHAARALRYGNFNTIGLVAHRFARTGEARTIEGVVSAARAEGYTVSLVDITTPSSDEVTAAAQRLSNLSVDGLVIIRAEGMTPQNLVLPPGLPVVVSDSRLVGRMPAVGADQESGARQAVEHLLALGHPTVHHLAGPADSRPAAVREESWRATLEAAGRPVPPPLRGDWTLASGYELGSRIADDPTVTAVFAANDEMAAGLLRALHERSVRVPQDVSVVGFDDIAVAEYLWPPLTTARQDFGRIGTELVTLLLVQVRTGIEPAGQHVVVPVPLIVRASTGPYRHRSTPPSP